MLEICPVEVTFTTFCGKGKFWSTTLHVLNTTTTPDIIIKPIYHI